MEDLNNNETVTMDSELLTKAIGGLFWKYSVLALVGILFSCLAVILDGNFMGNGVATMALAAIAVAVSFMYFAMGLSSMLGIGGTTAAGIKLGDGDEEGARDVYGTILVFSLIV